MTTYFVDPAASGNDDGTTATDAWTTLQRAIDGTNGTQPVAGDIVECRGTETVSTQIDMDGASGDSTSGFVTYVGVNASGVEDGTRYELDGNGNTLDIMRWNGPDQVKMSNFEFHNVTGDCISTPGYSASNHNVFENVYMHDATQGFNGGTQTFQRNYYYRLWVQDMSSHGIDEVSGVFEDLTVIDCGGSGFILTQSEDSPVFINFVMHSNAADNISVAQFGGSNIGVFKGGVIDEATGDGLQTDANTLTVVSGCRFTDNAVAINSDFITIVHHSYMPNATEDRDNTTQTSGIVDHINEDGTDTNNFAGTDVDAGYTTPASDDFNLTATATLRAVAIPLDATNKNYISAGLEPSEPVGGGGSAGFSSSMG